MSQAVGISGTGWVNTTEEVHAAPWEASLGREMGIFVESVRTERGVRIPTVIARVRTNRADACLIAAAPDLLAICQKLQRLRYLNEPGGSNADMVELRAAIAKATGVGQ